MSSNRKNCFFERVGLGAFKHGGRDVMLVILRRVVLLFCVSIIQKLQNDVQSLMNKIESKKDPEKGGLVEGHDEGRIGGVR